MPSVASTLRLGVAEVVRLQRSRTLTSSATQKPSLDKALAKKAGVKLTMKSLRRGFGCRYAGKVSAHILITWKARSFIGIGRPSPYSVLL